MGDARDAERRRDSAVRTRVRWLVDNEEAWGHTQKVIARPRRSTSCSSTSMSTSSTTLEDHEKPKIVLGFDPSQPDRRGAQSAGIDPDERASNARSWRE